MMSQNVPYSAGVAKSQLEAFQKLKERKPVTWHSAKKGTPPSMQHQVLTPCSPSENEHRRWMASLNVRGPEATAGNLGLEGPAQEQRGKDVRETVAVAKRPNAESPELARMPHLCVLLLETTRPIMPCFAQKTSGLSL